MWWQAVYLAIGGVCARIPDYTAGCFCPARAFYPNTLTRTLARVTSTSQVLVRLEVLGACLGVCVCFVVLLACWGFRHGLGQRTRPLMELVLLSPFWVVRFVTETWTETRSSLQLLYICCDKFPKYHRQGRHRRKNTGNLNVSATRIQ